MLTNIDDDDEKNDIKTLFTVLQIKINSTNIQGITNNNTNIV
jgi:hypothetical protein